MDLEALLQIVEKYGLPKIAEALKRIPPDSEHRHADIIKQLLTLSEEAFIEWLSDTFLDGHDHGNPVG